MSTCRRMKVDPYLSPCTKLKTKWINLTTLNLTEEKVGSSLQDMGTGEHFLGRTQVAQSIRESMNEWDHLKLRSFCKAKDTVSKTKRLPSDWEKIFTNPSSDKGLISKIYKELKKLDTKTLINPIKKWGTELNREFSTEEVRMAKRYLRSCSTSLAIREMQIETTLRYHLTPVRLAKLKTQKHQ